MAHFGADYRLDNVREEGGKVSFTSNFQLDGTRLLRLLTEAETFVVSHQRDGVLRVVVKNAPRHQPLPRPSEAEAKVAAAVVAVDRKYGSVPA